MKIKSLTSPAEFSLKLCSCSAASELASELESLDSPRAGRRAAVVTEKQCHPIPLSAWMLPVHQRFGLCLAQKTGGGGGSLGHSPAVVPGEVSWEGSFLKREASRGEL